MEDRVSGKSQTLTIAGASERAGAVDEPWSRKSGNRVARYFALVCFKLISSGL